MEIVSRISISFFIAAVIFTHLTTISRSRADQIETFLEEHKQTVEVIATGIIFEELLSTSKDDPEYNQN